MRILREYLGGSQEIDLDTLEGYEDFWRNIVQDHETADWYISILEEDGEVIVNESEPVFVERYTVLDKTPQN